MPGTSFGLRALRQQSRIAPAIGASVRRQLTTLNRRPRGSAVPNVIVVSVLTAPSTFGSGGGGALAMAASAATFSFVTFSR